MNGIIFGPYAHYFSHMIAQERIPGKHMARYPLSTHLVRVALRNRCCRRNPKSAQIFIVYSYEKRLLLDWANLATPAFAKAREQFGTGIVHANLGICAGLRPAYAQLILACMRLVNIARREIAGWQCLP
jgi:hypothetical protein